MKTISLVCLAVVLACSPTSYAQSPWYDVTVFNGHYIFSCTGKFHGQDYAEAGAIDASTLANGIGTWTLNSTMNVTALDGSTGAVTYPMSNATFTLWGGNLGAFVSQDSGDSGSLYVSQDGNHAKYVSRNSDGRIWVCDMTK